jgi:long-chain acyl-CoA synthetase
MRGEIEVSGPQVMQGYFRAPEETARVWDGRWLRTGDLGLMTFNDCLKILGRIKDTVVLMSGENIEPVPIENRINQCAWIAQCMVVGQDQKYLGVLLVPEWEALQTLDPEAADLEALLASAKVRAAVQRFLHESISTRNGFKSFERIHAWRWVSKPFEVGDEMTATFKLRRHVIAERYRGLIDAIFAHDSAKG